MCISEIRYIIASIRFQHNVMWCVFSNAHAWFLLLILANSSFSLTVKNSVRKEYSLGNRIFRELLYFSDLLKFLSVFALLLLYMTIKWYKLYARFRGLLKFKIWFDQTGWCKWRFRKLFFIPWNSFQCL